MYFVLHQALFNRKAPRIYRRRVANHVTYGSHVVVTDIILGNDNAVNPNQKKFSPDIPWLSSSDPSSNDIAVSESSVRL
jgi:hypothetical protein